MTERVSLEKAELAQLRKFATEALGLELAPTMNAATIAARIKQAAPSIIDIPVADEAPAPSLRTHQGARTTRVRPGTETMKKPVIEVMINIHTSAEPGGRDPVALSHNGVAIFVPRGENVWVREDYLECLDHAEGFAYQPYSEGMGGLESEPRLVMSYPYSLV